jgi:hypothetical protein
MANPKIQGLAVVYGMQDNTAAATNADATWQFNAEVSLRDFNTQSGQASAADKVLDLTGGSGKIVTTILQEQITDVEFDLVPIGTGARTTLTTADSAPTTNTIAAARTASALVRKNDKLVTAYFPVGDYNGTWRIMECNSKIRSDGALVFHVKVQTSENITDLVAAGITA